MKTSQEPSRLPIIMVLLMGIALLPACNTTILQPQVDAAIAPAYQGASIQVDLVGVNNSELAAWNAKPVDDYFTPGDIFRGAAAKRTLDFADGKEGGKSLAANDPIWQTWKAKGVSNIVVMADLPGYTIPMGGVDLRRQIIPLSSDSWDKSPPVITIQVGPTGIILVPAPKVQ